jgi:hypothetical protein
VLGPVGAFTRHGAALRIGRVNTVYAYYAAWRDEGIFAQLNYELPGLARVKGRPHGGTHRLRDRHPEREDLHQRAPHQPRRRPRQEDRRPQARHRHRHPRNHPRRDRRRAGLSDNAIGIRLLDQTKAAYPAISKTWVDSGFRNAVIEHGAKLGIDVEVVARKTETCGFRVVKRR